MKLNKILIGVFCILTTLFCSCSEDDYTRADLLSNAQVYFSNSAPASYSFNMAEGVQEFSVPLLRINTAEELTVKLVVEGADGDTISVPQSVTFAAGKATVDIPVKYNSSLMGYNNPKKISIKLADEKDKTVYGFSDYDFTVTIASPWKSLGKATYREGFVASIYGIDALEYKVEIQENLLTPGLYRLVNPYGKAYEYNEDGDWDASKDYYLEIHAEDPSRVYIETQKSGMAWSYGEFSFGSLAGYYLSNGKPESAESYYGTLENGLITFPKKALLASMAGYNNGGLMQTNAGGEFRVLLPGYVLVDYSIALDYVGLLRAKDNTYSAVVTVALGADVKKAKAVVVDASADANAIAEAIANEELAAVEIKKGQNYIPVNVTSDKLKVVAVALTGTDINSVQTFDLDLSDKSEESEE